MMDNNRRLGIFVVVTGVVLIGAMAIYTYVFNRQQNAEPKPDLDAQRATQKTPEQLMEEARSNQPAVEYKFDPVAEKNRELNAEDIRKMSLSFAERLGSYSNQSNYGNISDLKIFMTEDMKTWADGYIVDLKKKDVDNSKYYGITTIAISGDVQKFDSAAGEAQVVVSTQRRETTSDGQAAKVFNQNITIDLVKIDKEWKVDGAFWEKN